MEKGEKEALAPSNCSVPLRIRESLFLGSAFIISLFAVLSTAV